MTSTPELSPIDGGEARDYWVGRAPLWRRYAPEIERMLGRFNPPFLEAAQLAPGLRVLDLASGAGEPAMTIAQAVGPEGSVAATDLVPEMVEGTKTRIAEAGAGNMSCEIADIQNLPFPDNSFDRVTCRFGIMFAPDPLRGLQEARRVLRPGGRSVWMVWGPLVDTTIFAVLHREVREFLDLPRDPDLPQFRFGTPGLLESTLEQAGFTGVDVQDQWFDGSPPANVPFWHANLHMAFTGDIEGMVPERRAALEARLTQAFEAHRDGDRYRLRAHIRVGVGTRPA